MKSSEPILTILNGLIASEAAAIAQYRAACARFSRWGYQGLIDAAHARYEAESEHMKELIDRSLLLGGDPAVSAIGAVNAPDDPLAILQADLAAELKAVADYTVAIELCNYSDSGTRLLLEHILADHDLDAVEGVDNLIGRRIRLAEDHGVGAGSCP